MNTDEISKYLEKLEGIQNGFQNFSITKYLWVIPIIVLLLIIFFYINYRVKIIIARKGAYQALQMWEEEKNKKANEQLKTNIQ